MLHNRRILKIERNRLAHIRIQFIKRIGFGETTRKIRNLGAVSAAFLSDNHVIQTHSQRLPFSSKRNHYPISLRLSQSSFLFLSFSLFPDHYSLSTITYQKARPHIADGPSSSCQLLVVSLHYALITNHQSYFCLRRSASIAPPIRSNRAEVGSGMSGVLPAPG